MTVLIVGKINWNADEQNEKNGQSKNFTGYLLVTVLDSVHEEK